MQHFRILVGIVLCYTLFESCYSQNQADCPATECGFCQNGYVLDSAGCRTCVCRRSCAAPQCTNSCPNGFKANHRGCATCQCLGVNEKPGTCPAPDAPLAVCTTHCGLDEDCPGFQKCCGSCPRQCENPVPVVKPGRCPASNPVAPAGVCAALCDSDEHCSGIKKCCGSCPRKCTKPEGLDNDPLQTCPARFSSKVLTRTRPCTDKKRRRGSCMTNDECPEGKICCGNCRKRCISVTARNRRRSRKNRQADLP